MKAQTKKQMRNIRITENGAVHAQRFSWHTACGVDFDIDDSKVTETSEPVTCGRCLAQRKYLYAGEIEGFGLLVDRNVELTELINELRDAMRPNDEDAAEFYPYTYIIKVFTPFQAMGKESMSMVAHLPDDACALSLAETLVWWRIRAIQGELMAFQWGDAQEGIGD